jgi:mRNA interferase MazF
VWGAVVIHRGEIYLIDLANQVGSEQSGVRPAIIVQNETGNIHSPTTIICPLTSKKKSMSATHVSLTPEDAGIVVESTVLCEQVRVIDKARIKKKLGEVKNLKKINDINEKILVSFGIRVETLCTQD